MRKILVLLYQSIDKVMLKYAGKYCDTGECMENFITTIRQYTTADSFIYPYFLNEVVFFLCTLSLNAKRIVKFRFIFITYYFEIIL